MAKIWLDAGHGGSDSGASYGGLVEKTLNLTTTMKTKQVLERHGIQVGMSRTSDVTMSLQARTDAANRWGANYFVSIHHNAGGGDGIEAIHTIYAGKGEQLAKRVADRINTHTGQNKRPRATYSKKGSSGKDYYHVIRETAMPAAIVECAFLDSNDRFIVDTVAEQEKMGEAIAMAILEQLGVAFKPETPVTPPSTGAGSGNGKTAIVTASALNVRAGRGTNHKVLTVLNKGTRVKLCYLLNGWWSIDVPLSVSSSGVGFVSGQYLRIE